MSEWARMFESFDRVEPTTTVPARAIALAAELERPLPRRRAGRPLAIGAALVAATLVVAVLVLAAHAHRDTTKPTHRPDRSAVERATMDAQAVSAATARAAARMIATPGRARIGRGRTLNRLFQRADADLRLLGYRNAFRRPLDQVAGNRVVASLVLTQRAVDLLEPSTVIRVPDDGFAQSKPQSTGRRSPSQRRRHHQLVLAARLDAYQIAQAANALARPPTGRLQPRTQGVGGAAVHLNQHLLWLIRHGGRDLLAQLYVAEARDYRYLRMAQMFRAAQGQFELAVWEDLALAERIDLIARRQGTLAGTRAQLEHLRRHAHWALFWAARRLDS